MGQSCSFAQQQQGHNPYRQGKSCINNTHGGTKRNLLQSHILTQRLSLKQVTLIKGSQQLIYEFHNTIVKLPVKSWDTQKQQIQKIQIEEFLADGVSFICRVKYCYQSYPVWRVVKVVRMKDEEGLKEFAMLYYRLYQIRGIQSDSKSFVFADKCFLQTNKHNLNNHSTHSFIIQSQLSLSPFVPLRTLGFFMKLNHICWQDGEFLSIIQKSLNLISAAGKKGTFLFQEWLIDANGQVFSIGTLVQKLGQEEQLMYLQELTLYLCECLYGQKLTTVSSYQQLSAQIVQKQRSCKYKHSQSSSALLRLYKAGTIQKIDQKPRDVKLTNSKSDQPSNIIQHYVESYRSKRRVIQSCAELAVVYGVLGQSEKASEILYERMSVLMYQLMGEDGNGIRGDKDNMRKLGSIGSDQLGKHNYKDIAEHDGILNELYAILSHLISLSHQLSSPPPHLQHLLNQYLRISLILSSSFRHSSQPIKSLSTLLQARRFIDHQIQSWQLELHIAMCYFYAGDFQQAEVGLEKSLGIDCNEINVCFAIMFYTSLLNWQQALQYLQHHQSLIISHNSILDLLLSKIFLCKSLCITKANDSSQRVDLLYQTINIASKVLDYYKGVPQIVLLQGYEIVGDSYFYLKHYATAREFYNKGLAISSAIQFAKTKQEHTRSQYQPVCMMRAASLQYTRSRSIYQSKHQESNQNSILKTRKTPKSSVNNKGLLLSGDSKTIEQQLQQRQRQINRQVNPIRQQQKQQYHSQVNPQSFISQLKLLFNPSKRSVLLSSIANCYFMQQNFSQAIKFYKQAQSQLPTDSNKDLRNSIIGNRALCEVEMVKNNRTDKLGNIDIEVIDSVEECKLRLEKIMDETRDEDPEKLLNDVNYIFLLNELNSI